MLGGNHWFSPLSRIRVSLVVGVVKQKTFNIPLFPGYLLLVGGHPNHPFRVGSMLSIFDLLDGMDPLPCQYHDIRIHQSVNIGTVVKSKPLIFAGRNDGDDFAEEILWTFHRDVFNDVCQDMIIYPSSVYFAISLGDRLLVALKGLSKMVFVTPPDYPGLRCVMRYLHEFVLFIILPE